MIKTEEKNSVFDFDIAFSVENYKRNQRTLLDSFRKLVLHFKHLKLLNFLWKDFLFQRKP